MSYKGRSVSIMMDVVGKSRKAPASGVSVPMVQNIAVKQRFVPSHVVLHKVSVVEKKANAKKANAKFKSIRLPHEIPTGPAGVYRAKVAKTPAKKKKSSKTKQAVKKSKKVKGGRLNPTNFGVINPNVVGGKQISKNNGKFLVY